MKYTFECFGHRKVFEDKLEIPYVAANDWSRDLPEMQFDKKAYPKPQPYNGSWVKSGANGYRWVGHQYFD